MQFIPSYWVLIFQLIEQIQKHWNMNSSPEMILEKLQMIATANVAPNIKYRWLKQ